MEETQLFRLAGKTATIKIPCDYVDGQNVVYWEDIEQVFPGVQHVVNGEHYPGVVLDAVLLSSGEDTVGRHKNTTDAEKDEEMANMSTSDNGASTLSRTCVLATRSTSPSPKSGSRTTLSFKQIMKLAQKGSMESSLEEQLVSSLPPDIQVQVRGSTNRRESLIQVVKNGQVNRLSEQLVACLQELDNKMMDINELASRIMDLVFKNNEQSFEIMDLISKNSELLIRVNEMQRILDSRQDEMKQLQIQVLDQLALLQHNVSSLLTQTYELHEHPIPRLFIVLPADSPSWNPSDFFSNKFRLYFLCECGDRTKSTNSKIPHHIHLAKHEGYDIDRTKEFFQQYGSYVLTILRMLKFGISVAGIAVPVLSHLIRVDTLDQASKSLRLLKNTIESGVYQVIEHIEKVSSDEGGGLSGFAGQMRSSEAWKGSDIRQLDTFLQSKNEKRVPGNLYRTLTGEGHIKWVCIDHYREIYNEKSAEAFHNTVKALGGSFDESIGRVELTLFSRMQAEQFYSALEKAKSVYELKVELDWESSQSDFKKLRNTLAISNVGVLELYLKQQDVSTKDIVLHQRYDPVLDIMRHPSIKSFTIRGPQDFSKQSGLLSRNDDFCNLRHLDVSFFQLKDDIPGIKCLIAKASNLSSLAVGTGTQTNDNDSLLQACNAIVQNQTYTINFKDWSLSISPPPRESNQSMEWMEHLFKFYCRGTTQKLEVDKLDELTMDALAKATKNGSVFNDLALERNDRLGDPFINNISSVVARSELYKLRIHMREDEGRVRIMESLQWIHLRELNISLNPETFETSVMRVLVDGVKKMSGKVNLKTFRLYSDWSTEAGALSMPQGDLLQDFIALLSTQWLVLKVAMTLEQLLSLLRLIDFSRLRALHLWTRGFDSAKVDAILDGLRHATKLEKLSLCSANITDEQRKRVSAKGVSLIHTWT
ncbi:hypothetical protein BGX34_011542 [Mortierella sp. NVP85]|nr:hypothetical protein BGX34_011542 [Mortierella sp. NVP85]